MGFIINHENFTIATMMYIWSRKHQFLRLCIGAGILPPRAIILEDD